VLVDGRVVGRMTLDLVTSSVGAGQAMLLGSAALRSPILDVRLRTPDARSPRAAGVSGDRRVLGALVRALSLGDADEYPLGAPVDMDSETTAGWLAGGWAPVEAGGRWTVGCLARLLLRADRSAPALDVEIETDMAIVQDVGRLRLSVAVAIAGRRAVTVPLSSPDGPEGVHRGRLDAPVAAGEEIVLGVRVRLPPEPAALSDSVDGRALGLHVRRIVLHGAGRQ
jgi:hypothetical protein